MDVALIVLFAVWGIASFLGQLPGPFWVTCRRRANILGLLPFWPFFSSVLCGVDLRLAWRWRLPDGSAGPWEILTQIPPRPMRAALWHPERRPLKAGLDLCYLLVEQQAYRKLPLEALREQQAYRFVLAWVGAQLPGERPEGATFQFGVIAPATDRPTPRLYFLSGAHA